MDETIDVIEHMHLKQYYVTDSSKLKDDGKNILDHAARMFTQMSMGEVVSFVACSLLVVVSCTILLIHMVKFSRQQPDFLSVFSRWFPRSNAWKVDLSPWAASQYQGEQDEDDDKDKMVASVLHNLRVDNVAMGINNEYHEQVDTLEGLDAARVDGHSTHNCDEGSIHEEITQHRTILRSQLPPLPGVGRVLSIPGFTFVDDSMQINSDDDRLTAAETTALGSRTSCRSSELESCSIQSIFDESESLETLTVRRRK